ncbi:hypothetical protein BSAF29S_04827 [Bacillus safensis subsp. safensis]
MKSLSLRQNGAHKEVNGQIELCITAVISLRGQVENQL